MKSVSKITGVNLAIMLAYSLGIRFSYSSSERALGILITSAVVIGLHVLILLLISIVYYAGKQKEEGRAFLLSTGLVLLIGFSSCWANASI